MNVHRLVKRARVLKIHWVLGLAVFFVLLTFGLNWFLPKDLKGDLIERFPAVRELLPVFRKVRKISDIFYWPYFFKKTDLPVYEIFIKPEDLGEMEKVLPGLDPKSFLTDENILWRKAKLKYQGEEYDIEMRFRGSRGVHWNAEKKSIRIKFLNNENTEGISRMNFIIPDDRNFIVEELNYYRAEKLGLMHPRTFFGILKINNKSQGLYYIIEAWSPEFLAGNEVADESNFFDMDEGEVWFGRQDDFRDNLICWDKYTSESFHDYDDYSALDLFIKLPKVKDDLWFREQFFDLVDEDSFYNSRIVALLMNSYHDNFHLYYNRDNGKFYFIPWDIEYALGMPASVDLQAPPLYSKIFNIPEFMHERNRRLYEYVKDENNLRDDLAYYDKVYEEIKTGLYKDRAKVYTNFWADAKIKQYRELVIDNFQKIRAAFDLARAIVKVEIKPKDLGVGKETLARIEALVDNFTDIELEKISLPLKNERPGFENWKLFRDANNNDIYDWEDELIGRAKVFDGKIIFEDLSQILMTRRELTSQPEKPNPFIQTKYNYFIVGSEDGEAVDWDKIEFKMSNYFTGKELDKDNINVHLIDGESFRYLEQVNWTKNEFLKKYPFFSGNGQEFILRSGSYNINETVIVPRGYSLKIEAGTQLRLGAGVSLISYGPVEIAGLKERPVVFTASDRGKPWGVLGIQSAKTRSRVRYARFENGGDGYVNGAYYSGMLAAHYSDIEVRDSIFTGASGDDGLNVKKALALITRNYFYKNGFDAIDLDWAWGEVKNNYFKDNGNDGIDLGGAKDTLVAGNQVAGSGDKCLSIGEDSKGIAVFDNLFRDCVTGIAVKDNSEVKIINNTILNNETGIAVYEKKPLFGGASPEVYNSIIWGNDKAITLDDKSGVEISYSDVTGGFEGKDNLDKEPDLRDNYISGLEAGSREAAQEFLEEERGEFYLGIVSPAWFFIPF